MKDRKINVDRPQLKSEEILGRRNFEEVVRNHQAMTKPFYKQNWFIGTTGLASLGLIIGGTLAFQNMEASNQQTETVLNTDAPPNLVVPENNLIVQNAEVSEATNDLAKQTIHFNQQNSEPIEENFTQEITQEDPVEMIADQPEIENTITEEVVEDTQEDVMPENTEPVVETPQNESNSFMDLTPRISNKMGGSITRNELLDNKGITTEGDVSIIHFELHLIDGLGGKVYEEESNQLNDEMKDALDNVEKGETIYFENIRGKIKNGTEVHLNPLRYVLMN